MAFVRKEEGVCRDFCLVRGGRVVFKIDLDWTMVDCFLECEGRDLAMIDLVSSRQMMI